MYVYIYVYIYIHTHMIYEYGYKTGNIYVNQALKFWSELLERDRAIDSSVPQLLLHSRLLPQPTVRIQ